MCKECFNYSKRIVSELKKTAPPKTIACECCGTTNKELVFDHCHESLTFRGWLCRSCNLGIGHLGDNLSGVTKAINYLSTNGCTT
jgi:hypothetical protein